MEGRFIMSGFGFGGFPGFGFGGFGGFGFGLRRLLIFLLVIATIFVFAGVGFGF
jgi:hypothetical protein